MASKRQARFIVNREGRPELVGTDSDRSRSEHGLGHLQRPVEDKDWMDAWWTHLLCRELGIPDEAPEWFEEPAIGRLTVTSPREAQAFAAYNEGLPYDEQVTPWCFMSVAHLIATERGRDDGVRCLIAPFESDPAKRLSLAWRDRADTGRAPRHIRVDESLEIRDEGIAVQSYRDYFEEYRRHPERKMLGPDGEPCKPWTRGLLQPRVVQAEDELQRVGKESNRLAETALPLELDEGAAVEYPGPPVCEGCGTELAGRHRKWCGESCRKRLGRTRGQGDAGMER